MRCFTTRVRASYWDLFIYSTTMAVGPTGPVWPPWCPRHPPCSCRRYGQLAHAQAQAHSTPRASRYRRWRRRRPRPLSLSLADTSASCPASSSGSGDDEDEGGEQACGYHSDTETSMPGGFENSAMKSCFSLSSLQPSSTSLESPEHARSERPYNSLRKSCKKDREKESWRRSWDRRDDTKEFWNALEPNYLYLMDSNLIDSCKEARRDLQYGASPSHDWSFEQFCGQFTELDLWLTSIQETILSKEDTATDRNLRLSHMEEMHRKTYKRKVFNNQGGRLAAKYPQLQGEVRRRVEHLNRKWEVLEQTVTPRKHSHPDHLHTYAMDVEHEVNCIRKWLRVTERRLLPINFQTVWTLTELEAKAKEHQVIQQEVELHGKSVCSLLKRCDRLLQVEAEAEGEGSPAANASSRERLRVCHNTQRYARDLERRWQHLYLRSLEWICYIEAQTERAKNRSPAATSSPDSDDCEPVLKHPRLSTSPYPSPVSQDVDDDNLMEVSTTSVTEMIGPQKELSVSLTASYPPPLNRSSSGSMHISSTDDVINKNYNLDLHNRRQSMPTDAARKLFPDETSKFTTWPSDSNSDLISSSSPGHPSSEDNSYENKYDGAKMAAASTAGHPSAEDKSVRAAPNQGTYYFKHRDTESEQDESQMDQSSEEGEWTYRCGQGEEGEGGESPSHNDESSLCHSTETLASATKSVKQEPLIDAKLQRLIEGAEVMVTPTRNARVFPPLIIDSTKSKKKVKDWILRSNWNADLPKAQAALTDASYDGSAEEEERQSSGDFNSCATHCHQSVDMLQTLDSPLVDKTPAPLISSTPDHFKVSPVVLRAKRKEGTPQRPLSESGLPQQLAQQKLLQSLSESALNHMDPTTTPTQSVKMDTSAHGTLSSSTTMEELPGQAREGSGGSYSSNSLNRRRKNKLRKRNMGRKSNSGSDGHDPPSPLKSVPTIRRLSTSCTESEEEVDGESKTRAGRKKQLAQPHFKLGPSGGPVTMFPCVDKTLSADSSFSEQAWDSYQEKYMSEAYSEEVPDHETTKRLLDFGDDYRNFFDSQSDGASSLGVSRPVFTRRRRLMPLDREGSDSEGTEVRSLITKSQEQWTWCDQNWTKISIGSPHLVYAKDFAEMISTCKDNVSVLTQFLVRCETVNEFVEESQEIRGLIGQWEQLELRTEELQRVRSLQREMAGLRDEMAELSKRLADQELGYLQDRDHLDLTIQMVQGEQGNLREHKTRLIEVNTAVHKFFTDSGQQGAGVEGEVAHRLKEDVKELYLVWDDTNTRVTQQLDRLKQLSAVWKTFETHLSELNVALRGDHNTLRMLDSALQEGPVSQDVASSVIDVAKVLSEKQDLCQSVYTLSSAPVVLTPPASAEGSLSGVESGTDSGISDSGSEQESERERRLSALRRLARQLEAVLSPNSQAIIDMARSIEQTEVELRGLQKTCRELIVRTAVCADNKLQDTPALPPHHTLSNRKGKNLSVVPQNFMELEPDDDDPDPDKGSTGWLWRVIRAALPFQMAILAIFCVACLLEPHCCDSMNNLNFSLTPQLRYTRGPPPV